MSSGDIDLYVQYRIANAPMREFPYPHLYVRDIFPDDFYARLEYLPNTLHDIKVMPPQQAAQPDAAAAGSKVKFSF